MSILENHISENIRTVFDKYFDKYCVFEETLKKTRDVLSDINYFDAHIKRTQESKFFKYTVTPSQQGSIHNSFVKQIGESILYFISNQDQCMIYVAIYEIMDKIFDNWWEEKSVAAQEYFELYPVLEYFLDIKNDTCVSNFIGCSHGLDDFYNKLNELRNKS